MAGGSRSLGGFRKTIDAHFWKALLGVAPKATKRIQGKKIYPWLCGQFTSQLTHGATDSNACTRGGVLRAFHLPAAEEALGGAGGQPLPPLWPGALDLGTQWPNLIVTTDLESCCTVCLQELKRQKVQKYSSSLTSSL